MLNWRGASGTLVRQPGLGAQMAAGTVVPALNIMCFRIQGLVECRPVGQVKRGVFQALTGWTTSAKMYKHTGSLEKF